MLLKIVFKITNSSIIFIIIRSLINKHAGKNLILNSGLISEQLIVQIIDIDFACKFGFHFFT